MGAARPMTVRLDPRPARPLTSREISKIIGGALGGLLQEIPSAEVRDVMVAVRAVVEVGLDLGDSYRSLPSSQVWAAGLGGVVGGLVQWCDRQAVMVAIDWLLEHWSAVTS